MGSITPQLTGPSNWRPPPQRRQEVKGAASQRLLISFVRILPTVSSAMPAHLPPVRLVDEVPLFPPLPQNLMAALHPGVGTALLCQRASPALFFSSQSTSPAVATYHLQRALPGGIVLMELAFQVRQQETKYGLWESGMV